MGYSCCCKFEGLAHRQLIWGIIGYILCRPWLRWASGFTSSPRAEKSRSIYSRTMWNNSRMIIMSLEPMPDGERWSSAKTAVTVPAASLAVAQCAWRRKRNYPFQGVISCPWPPQFLGAVNFSPFTPMPRRNTGRSPGTVASALRTVRPSTSTASSGGRVSGVVVAKVR